MTKAKWAARVQRDAAEAEVARLKLEKDELHDQRHAEARKADAAESRVAALTKALRGVMLSSDPEGRVHAIAREALEREEKK